MLFAPKVKKGYCKPVDSFVQIIFTIHKGEMQKYIAVEFMISVLRNLTKKEPWKIYSCGLFYCQPNY